MTTTMSCDLDSGALRLREEPSEQRSGRLKWAYAHRDVRDFSDIVKTSGSVVLPVAGWRVLSRPV